MREVADRAVRHHRAQPVQVVGLGDQPVRHLRSAEHDARMRQPHRSRMGPQPREIVGFDGHVAGDQGGHRRVVRERTEHREPVGGGEPQQALARDSSERRRESAFALTSAREAGTAEERRGEVERHIAVVDESDRARPQRGGRHPELAGEGVADHPVGLRAEQTPRDAEVRRDRREHGTAIEKFLRRDRHLLAGETHRDGDRPTEASRVFGGAQQLKWRLDPGERGALRFDHDPLLLLHGLLIDLPSTVVASREPVVHVR